MNIRQFAITSLVTIALCIDTASAQDARTEGSCRGPEFEFGSRFTAQLVRENHTPNQPADTVWQCPALLAIEAIPYAAIDENADSSQFVVGYNGLQTIRQTFINSSSFPSAVDPEQEGCMVEFHQSVTSAQPLLRPRQSSLVEPGLRVTRRVVKVLQRWDPGFLGVGVVRFTIDDQNRFGGSYQSCQYVSVGEVRP